MARSFEARFTSFVVGSIAKVSATLVAFSNEAMAHFNEHGDPRKLEFMFNNLPKVGAPGNLLLWARAFSPLAVSKNEDGSLRFSKDKGKDANPFNIDASIATNYIDYNKPAAATDDSKYETADFDKSLVTAVKTWTKRITDGDVDATMIDVMNARVKALEAFIANNYSVIINAPVAGPVAVEGDVDAERMAAPRDT